MLSSKVIKYFHHKHMSKDTKTADCEHSHKKEKEIKTKKKVGKFMLNVDHVYLVSGNVNNCSADFLT